MTTRSARHLINEILGTGAIAAMRGDNFAARFLKHDFTIADLKKIHDHISRQSTICIDNKHQAGETIPACELITPVGVLNNEKPVAIIAQVHGNEPAGLAAYLLLQALKETGQLTRPVLFAIGSPLAAEQYFKNWQKAPHEHQASRDIYRCGVGADGQRLRDPNRIPEDYAQRTDDPHSLRDHQLDVIADNVSGMLDIHTARGKLTTIMAFGDEKHIQGSPISSMLTNIDAAIGVSGNSISMAGLFSRHPNIEHVTGIEAGTHEDPESFKMAASFAMTWLHNLGVSRATPVPPKNPILMQYAAQKALTFGDMLPKGAAINDADKVYPVKRCEKKTALKANDLLIVGNDGDKRLVRVSQWTPNWKEPVYVVHQYEELESIAKGQVVAMAVPGGIEFKAPYDFGGVFVSKSSEFYSDPAVYPWPIAADKLNSKFAYPCIASPVQVTMPPHIPRASRTGRNASR